MQIFFHSYGVCSKAPRIFRNLPFLGMRGQFAKNVSAIIRKVKKKKSNVCHPRLGGDFEAISKMHFFLGIEGNVQISAGKSCLPNPTSQGWGYGMVLGVNL